MKLLINTNETSIDTSREYGQEKDMFRLKPNGLWYSIGEEWMEWCGENMPDFMKDKTIEIEIDYSKVHVVKTLIDVYHTFREYSWQPHKGITMMDWGKLAKDYSAMEIQDFSSIKASSFRSQKIDVMACTWLYSWDVSSGVIWDLSIIKSQTLIKK